MKRAAAYEEPASKKQKALTKFRNEFSKEFPCIGASVESANHAHCMVCGLSFKIGSGGKNDIKRHLETKSHKDNSKKPSTKITSFYATSARPKDEKTEVWKDALKAELVMCSFLIQHNLPFAAKDSLSECIRSALPDSAVAAAFKCGRTKATALIKELATLESNRLAELMRCNPFTIATDGSNDTSAGKKHFPLVVNIGTDEGVECGILAFRNCDGNATGGNFFSLIDTELETRAIPWNNCLAIGSDNAPNMVGHKSGMFAFAKDKHENIFKAGRVLHLVHIAAKKGASHIPVEEAIIEVYYYFKKSAVRQLELRQFQSLFDVEQRKCLKDVATWWLSIKNCVQRLLQNWDPLKSFFAAEKEAQKSALMKAKTSALCDFFRSPTNRLLAKFLLFGIKLFDSVLLGLQAEDPLIHTLLPSMEQLLQGILTKFVKPTAILGKELRQVDFNDVANQKGDSELGIDIDAMEFISYRLPRRTT